jgi:hypothetical protein
MAIHGTGPLAPPALVPQGAGVILGLRVRLVAGRLDARLAAGEDPCSDPVLAFRSARLTSGRARRRIAAGLERACRKADRRVGLSAAVPVHPGAVDVARPALLQLAAALRCRQSVRARGVALAQLLLIEADGPLYNPERPETLYEAARDALLALGPDGDPQPPDRGA